MNKKGFTLIELLAVIVILAIIALIATPIVLNIIKDSRESAGLRNAEMYLKGVETSVATATINNKKLADGTYPITPDGDICLVELTSNTCSKDNTLEVEMNGEKPTSGSVTITNGKITDLILNYSTGKTIVKKDEKLVYGEKEKTLAEVIVEDAKTKKYFYSETPNFDSITIDGEYGLYSAEDDYGTSYYFRGDVENNYVRFGAWKETGNEYKGCIAAGAEGSCVGSIFETIEACESAGSYAWCKELKYADEGNDMYWRIVRINGDRTVRLVYDGTSAVSNSDTHTAKIGSSVYNTNNNDAKYFGYTYDDGTGSQVDSTIKGVVDAWYETNLESDYGKYIADNIFCNDRKVTSTSGDYIYYGAYTRLETNKSPKLTCTQEADKYTVSSAKGNGLLTKPIGLMTADEMVIAGEKNKISNSTYYLYTGLSVYWSMSPYYINDDFAVVLRGDNLGYNGVSSVFEVRPVINLKADVKFTGKGTVDDPYVIVTE